jgi:hypothetical protein
MRATGVKGGMGFNPVTRLVSLGWGLTVYLGSSSQLPGYVAVWEGSCSARSRAAARTNELDADERRRHCCVG